MPWNPWLYPVSLWFEQPGLILRKLCQHGTGIIVGQDLRAVAARRSHGTRARLTHAHAVTIAPDAKNQRVPHGFPGKKRTAQAQGGA